MYIVDMLILDVLPNFFNSYYTWEILLGVITTRSSVWHDNSYSTVALPNSEIVLTSDTPYLALICELWGVYCEGFREN